MNWNKWNKSWIPIFFCFFLKKQFIWDSESFTNSKRKKKEKFYLFFSICSIQIVRAFRLTICFFFFFLAIKHGCKHVIQLAKIIFRAVRFKNHSNKTFAKKEESTCVQFCDLYEIFSFSFVLFFRKSYTWAEKKHRHIWISSIWEYTNAQTPREKDTEIEKQILKSLT